ncbi:MAG: ThiF family adenylyltransferase [Ectothiorhodospira sp.]
MGEAFHYEEAFSRNIGWVTREEQQILRHKRVAIGGMGGVGGNHLITMARLGVGRFSLSDLDVFEVANFNRQFGATMGHLNEPKLRVMEEAARDINPELDIRSLPDGLTLENIDAFLEGVDLYMDSLDMFALDIRRRVFQRCHDMGIPAITAAPMGMGTSMLAFVPDGMSFEEYFRFDDVETFEEKLIQFVIGVSPSMIQRDYLVEKGSVNFFRKKLPSTAMAIDLAAGVACSNGLKLLLGRGDTLCAPRGLHFDAYRNRLVKTWHPWGNRNPLQRYMFRRVRGLLLGREG